MAFVFTLLLALVPAYADDVINSQIQNDDGSWSFNVTFDNGSGLFGNTNVYVYVPDSGVAYDLSGAKLAMPAVAAAQKSHWVSVVGGDQTINWAP